MSRDQNRVAIRPYEPQDLPKIVRLFTNKYKKFILTHPLMPHKYIDVNTNEKMIQWLFENFDGVVSVEGDEIVGYLSGIIVPHFKSSRQGIFTPEWGHCIHERMSHELYYNLLEAMDVYWRSLGYYSHAISFLSNEQENLKYFFWDGYGMNMIDGISDLKPFGEVMDPLAIREANVYDWDPLSELLEEYEKSMTSYPTVQVFDINRALEELEKDLVDNSVHLWVAEKNRRLYGLVKTMEECRESCTIVRDRKTLGIGTCIVRSEGRNKGIGKTLINHVKSWAKEHRFERLTYALESPNVIGRHMFFKSFEPVCYTVIRHFDDRVEMKRNPEE